jgi:F0F1-type ATP synthase assembly protein I
MAKMSTEMIHLLGNYGHIGFTFAAAIFIGLGGGIYLDQKLFDDKTTPWFTFIGLAFGIAAGFKSLFDIIRQQNGREKKKETDDKD